MTGSVVRGAPGFRPDAIPAAAPAGDRGLEGFVVDPRPLGGIGPTPQPTEVGPPWSRDHRHG
jgi:hypothetical protein